MSLNWFKKQMINIALAMSSVEKNAFGQNSGQLDNPVNQERRHTQGNLMDSLKQGQITVEVEALRWRMYKVLKASESLTAEITGYDENNLPITKIHKTDKKRGLNKIKLDEFDNYQLEMVVDNTPIVTSSNDIMDNELIKLLDEVKINYDDKGVITGATHGEISAIEYFATTKSELPIKITHKSLPKFELETYVKKLNIRNIDDKYKLLEFYVSQYYEEDNRTSRLFISDIKKAILSPRSSSILDIKEVRFITNKTLGTNDFLEYQYKILNFDKIISFNGYYVIKFIAEVIVNGDSILEEYRVSELDKKYENKEHRNNGVL